VLATARSVVSSSGGLFAFSVEKKGEEEAGEGFECRETGRFVHKKSYIEQVSREAGWGIAEIEVSVIRKNKGVDVHGYLVILR